MCLTGCVLLRECWCCSLLFPVFYLLLLLLLLLQLVIDANILTLNRSVSSQELLYCSSIEVATLNRRVRVDIEDSYGNILKSCQALITMVYSYSHCREL